MWEKTLDTNFPNAAETKKIHYHVEDTIKTENPKKCFVLFWILFTKAILKFKI